jgi:ankyrin repeat protein
MRPAKPGSFCRHAAASWGHADLLQYLLQNGGDPNVCDNEDYTPMHMCEQYVDTPSPFTCVLNRLSHITVGHDLMVYLGCQVSLLSPPFEVAGLKGDLCALS